MADVVGDFTVTMAELRVVARFVADTAAEVLPVFEDAAPGDGRPREALAAAQAFADGAPRSRRQRTASLDAHRAAAEAATEPARLAARCAGDAASAAYLHPIAQASQVGHILRAAATAAHLAELAVGSDPAAAEQSLERSRRRATPVLVDVLRRYPPLTSRRRGPRVAQLMARLDAALRSTFLSRPSDPVLTERLVLTPICAGDLDELTVLHTDPLVAHWTGPWDGPVDRPLDRRHGRAVVAGRRREVAGP